MLKLLHILFYGYYREPFWILHEKVRINQNSELLATDYVLRDEHTGRMKNFRVDHRVVIWEDDD